MTRSRTLALSALAGVVAAVVTSDVALAAGPYGYGPGGHRRHYFGAFIMFLLLIAAVVLLVVLLMRNRHPLAATPTAPSAPPPPVAGPTSNAQSILADRLARGEISPEDYRAAIAVLREPPPAG